MTPQTTFPDAFARLVPYPFWELQVPITEEVMRDTVKPLLDHCAGLAQCCFLASQMQEGMSHDPSFTSTLAVLRDYLHIIVRIWEAQSAPEPGGEESQP